MKHRVYIAYNSFYLMSFGYLICAH